MRRAGSGDEGMETEEAGPTDESKEVTFDAFLLMLGTTALVHLGTAPDPSSGKTGVDLVQAKQVIDLLDVLKAKTAGNLTAGESQILDDLLFDLRMRYLEAVKRA
jgi:hypothetical protein